MLWFLERFGGLNSKHDIIDSVFMWPLMPFKVIFFITNILIFILIYLLMTCYNRKKDKENILGEITELFRPG